MNDLETELAARRPRTVQPAWRADILRAAQRTAAARRRRAVFWPAIAAAWAAIGFSHMAGTDADAELLARVGPSHGSWKDAARRAEEVRVLIAQMLAPPPKSSGSDPSRPLP